MNCFCNMLEFFTIFPQTLEIEYLVVFTLEYSDRFSCAGQHPLTGFSCAGQHPLTGCVNAGERLGD